MSARKLGTQHWTGLTPKVTFHRPPEYANRTPVVTKVKLKQRPKEWIKLNTEGIFTSITTMAGGGGVVGDERGSLLECFATPLSLTSGLEAEFQTLKIGIRMAKRWGNKIWIETGSTET